MHLTLAGNFDQLYFLRALKTLGKKLTLSKRIHLYILHDLKQSSLVLKQLPASERAAFRAITSSRKTSFSYYGNKQQLIVIILHRANAYLLRDQKALIGLLAHEILHLEQMQKGVYHLLRQSHNKVFSLYKQILLNLHQKHLIPVLDAIGQQAVLLLKDLYTNQAVIQKGFSHELLQYYSSQFSSKKTCPRPVFYDKLKQAVQKDPSILETLFTFEFSLLSVILPFKKYKEKHAKKLLYSLAHCYNLNTQDLLRKCKPFISYYLDHYEKPSKDFQEKYFHLIFTKVIEILV